MVLDINRRSASVDIPTYWEVDNHEYSIDDENQWKTFEVINDVDVADDDDESVHHRLDDDLWCDSVACLRRKHQIENLIEVFFSLSSSLLLLLLGCRCSSYDWLLFNNTKRTREEGRKFFCLRFVMMCFFTKRILKSSETDDGKTNDRFFFRSRQRRRRRRRKSFSLSLSLRFLSEFSFTSSVTLKLHRTRMKMTKKSKVDIQTHISMIFLDWRTQTSFSFN